MPSVNMDSKEIKFFNENQLFSQQFFISYLKYSALKKTESVIYDLS